MRQRNARGGDSTITVSPRQLNQLWRSIKGVDLSNGRKGELDRLAAQLFESGSTTIPASLVGDLNLEWHDDEPDVQAMTGLEVLAIAGTVATLFAAGYAIGYNIGIGSGGGSTVTVNESGDGNVEVNLGGGNNNNNNNNND